LVTALGWRTSSVTEQEVSGLIKKARSLSHLSLLHPTQQLIRRLVTEMNDASKASKIKAFKIYADYGLREGDEIKEIFNGVWNLVRSWVALERLYLGGNYTLSWAWMANGCATNTSIRWLHLRHTYELCAGER
jgi:hypothetical protein